MKNHQQDLLHRKIQPTEDNSLVMFDNESIKRMKAYYKADLEKNKSQRDNEEKLELSCD